MIYKIGNQKLTIITSETKEDKGTPHQVVSWRDMAETCRTLDAVCNWITPKDSPVIVDGIARAGFWGALFRNKWPNCVLHLNEKETNCLDVLNRNFPNDKITNFDIENWAPKKCDIAMLDFDDFTLRKADKWKNILQSWEKSCTYLIIVDSACFGFKFGNLKHYGVDKEEGYYYALNNYFKKISLNKRITTICKFTNAATLLLEKRGGITIRFIPPSTDLFLSKGDIQKGLFF
jgi:hypothetical protein